MGAGCGFGDGSLAKQIARTNAGLIGALCQRRLLARRLYEHGTQFRAGIAGELLLSVGLDQTQVDSLVAYKGWRLMMMIGTLPALLTFFFRIFVPESHRWEEEQQQGAPAVGARSISWAS